MQQTEKLLILGLKTRRIALRGRLYGHRDVQVSVKIRTTCLKLNYFWH